MGTLDEQRVRKEVASKVRLYRRLRGWSQLQLAEFLEVSLSTVRRLESEAKSVDYMKYVIRLADDSPFLSPLLFIDPGTSREHFLECLKKSLGWTDQIAHLAAAEDRRAGEAEYVSREHEDKDGVEDEYLLENTLKVYSTESISKIFERFKGSYYLYMHWEKQKKGCDVFRSLIHIHAFNREARLIKVNWEAAALDPDWDFQGWLIPADQAMCFIFERVDLGAEVACLLVHKEKSRFFKYLCGLMTACTPGAPGESMPIPASARAVLERLSEGPVSEEFMAKLRERVGFYPESELAPELIELISNKTGENEHILLAKFPKQK